MSKLIVVTGGTKGIGRAIVQKFASSGYDIITCSRHEDQLTTLKQAIEKSYTNVTLYPYCADMSDTAQVKAFSEFVCQKGRPVDILVNNAGYFVPGEIHTEPEGNLESMIRANLYSAYYMTRGIIDIMKRQKHGHIFNLCSVASFMAYPNGGSYAISKFALLGFSRCLREELKPHGIRVTAVMPGATFTASWEGADIPEDRFMPPDDVAEMIYSAYVLSPRTVVEDIILRPQLGDI